ncbi:MAG TPA: hypothetical protein VHN80_02600 [Kineosporiaceae bacterium]|nr:hypothetical protein [Kineosporiaceae bacterium]
MTASWGSQTEQWLWQRRAVGELAAILALHRDLPAIAWTVTSAGCTLAGHVNTLVSAGQVRATFARWSQALDLDETAGEHAAGGGTVYLQATADRHQVRVRLAATVFDDEPVQP